MSMPLLRVHVEAFIVWNGTHKRETIVSDTAEFFGWTAVYSYLVARQMEACERFRREMSETPVEFWSDASCYFVSEAEEVTFHVKG